MHDQNSLTPLHLSAWGGHATVTEALLAAGADVNSVEKASFPGAEHYGFSHQRRFRQEQHPFVLPLRRTIAKLRKRC